MKPIDCCWVIIVGNFKYDKKRNLIIPFFVLFDFLKKIIIYLTVELNKSLTNKILEKWLIAGLKKSERIQKTVVILLLKDFIHTGLYKQNPNLLTNVVIPIGLSTIKESGLLLRLLLLLLRQWLSVQCSCKKSPAYCGTFIL